MARLRSSLLLVLGRPSILIALAFVFPTAANARSADAEERFKANLKLFEAVCDTGLIGRQADLADRLLRDAESSTDLLLIARPLSRTTLIGRQGDVFRVLMEGNWDDRDVLLLIAEPLVNTELIGLQGDLFDRVWDPKLDFATKLRIALLLSRTTLIGRQGSVFDDLIGEAWNHPERLGRVLRALSQTTLVGRQAQVADRLAELAKQ